jgi:hypothetical protein
MLTLRLISRERIWNSINKEILYAYRFLQVCKILRNFTKTLKKS